MVLIYSILLLLGTVAGQAFHLESWHEPLSFLTSVCLAFIMIEVGMEFSRENKSLKHYGSDIGIAATAAILPAVLCAAYFIFALNSQWKSAMLMGISFAPTSAGVLFAMLMAAGLQATWVYQKARVLAVLDDLVTILLLTPIHLIIHGPQWNTFATLLFVAAFIFASFRFKNALKLPTSHAAFFIYGILLTAFVALMEHKANIHLEVLIPAFMLGCLLKPTNEHEEKSFFGDAIKGLFMLLVGLTFPKINIGTMPVNIIIGHVLALTVLANAGKFFLVMCYKQEANLKERMALGIAMFPRGEVGAAVLLIGLNYGIGVQENALAFLSLALNLISTGFFVWLVIKLLKSSKS